MSVMDALIRVHRHTRELNAVLGARMRKAVINLDSTEDFRRSVSEYKAT